MRTPDWQKWEIAWDHMAAGKGKKSSGIDKNLAASMRRLQELGYTWEAVHERLQVDPIGIGGILAEAEAGIPCPVTAPRPSAPSHTPPPSNAPPAALASTSASRTVAHPSPETERETFEQRQRTRIERQRAHWEREIQAGTKLMDLADRLLEAHRPYILERKKVSRRQDACPHCRGAVTVEEVHIHPAKVDVQGIVQAYREGAERTRVALALPRQMLAVHVSDVHAELSERLEAIDEAFKLAFRHGIERGLLSEAGALEIWDVARNKIGGIT